MTWKRSKRSGTPSERCATKRSSKGRHNCWRSGFSFQPARRVQAEVSEQVSEKTEPNHPCSLWVSASQVVSSVDFDPVFQAFVLPIIRGVVIDIFV